MQDTLEQTGNVVSIFADKRDDQWTSDDINTVEDLVDMRGFTHFLSKASRRQCLIAAAIYRGRAKQADLDYQHTYLRCARKLEEKAQEQRRPCLHAHEIPRPPR